MNNLKDWVIRSREEQRRAPDRYLASYPELFCDDTHVLMTQKTYDKIKQNCGRYDGTYPTGAYLGKMFLRGDCLCWFSISEEAPMTETIVKARIVQIVEE